MRKNAKQSKGNASANSNSVPKGMKALSSSFAPTWEPKIGDVIEGVFGPIKVVPLKQGNKTTDRRCTEFKTNDGKRFTIWESAGLKVMFDEVQPGTDVYIKYEGLGEAKRGQNPPKRFLVAAAD